MEILELRSLELQSLQLQSFELQSLELQSLELHRIHVTELVLLMIFGRSWGGVQPQGNSDNESSSFVK